MEVLFLFAAVVASVAVVKLLPSPAGTPPPQQGGGQVGSGGGGQGGVPGGGPGGQASSPPKLGGGLSIPTNVSQLVTDVLGAELTVQDFNPKGHPTVSGQAGAWAATGAAIILAVGITSPYAAPIAIALLALFNLAGAVEETVRNQASLSWLKRMAAQYKYDNYGRWQNPRAVFEFFIAGVKANPTDQAGGWDGVPLGNQGGFSTVLPQNSDGSFTDDDSDAAAWQAYLGLDASPTFTTQDGKTYNTRTTIKQAVLWALAQSQPATALDQVHKLCDAIAVNYPWLTGINGLSREVAGALYWQPRPALSAAQVVAQQQAQQQFIGANTVKPTFTVGAVTLTGGAAGVATQSHDTAAGGANSANPTTDSTHSGGQQSKGYNAADQY